jgi:hypothetical protein
LSRSGRRARRSLCANAIKVLSYSPRDPGVHRALAAAMETSDREVSAAARSEVERFK